VSRAGRVALLGGALLLAACGQDDKPAPTASSGGAASSPAGGAPAPAAAPPAASAGDAARGRQVWLAQCVACHNIDPAQPGPVGPPVRGSSPALVEARVLRAAYPPGYTPKRDTKVMPARPDLAPSVPDLAAFLR
jgi:mono/diheme cytochrome c family protein